MTNGLVTFRMLLSTAMATGLTLMACSSQKNVEVPAPRAGQVNPGGVDGGDPGAGNPALVNLQFPPGSLAQYLANGLVHYKITIASEPVADEGDFTMKNGKGEIKSRNWKIGASGDLIVDLTQGGALKLHGVAKNVKLKAGNNPINLTVTDASGNPVGTSTSTSTSTSSATTADLDIQIDATGGAGTGVNPPTVTDTGTGVGPNLIKYADIATLAKNSCALSACHATGATPPDLSSEAGFNGPKGGKTNLTKWLTGAGFEPMPKGAPASTFSSDDRAKLQSFVNSLSN